MAQTLIDEWLSLWTNQFTHRDAQNFRKVEDKQKDLIEVIKYETKIFTEPDGKKAGVKEAVQKYIFVL